MEFVDLGLIKPILHAVAQEGYDIATPIQAQTIPHVIEGRDVLGCAQTGTGKTAAFALPILHRLHESTPDSAASGSAVGNGKRQVRPIRALILSPTRELAAQIGASFKTYGHYLQLRHAEIYGGVSQHPQTRHLHQGIDILVATPGRLMDLMEQGFVNLSAVQTFVLDEADRMLDMGFINDIRRIATKLPKQRQTLMFSATMPAPIRKLAETLLTNPVEVHVSAVSKPADRIEQSVYHVSKTRKPALLEHLLLNTSISRALVFTRTKHGADRVVKQLTGAGMDVAAIHGNKTQNNRDRALANFRSGRIAVLVATDIAARGLDVDDISHVFNFDLPNEPETYVHRIGRTARAGASGTAIAFCDPEERSFLKDIERLMKTQLVVAEHELAKVTGHSTGGERKSVTRPGGGRSGGHGGGGNGGGGRGNRRGGGKPGEGSGNPAGRAAHPSAAAQASGRGRSNRGRPGGRPRAGSA